MPSRTMPAIALPPGGIRPYELPLTAMIQSNWMAFRSMLARGAARRRLARSIAHLDDRLLADAGLGPEHRGVGDHLLRHFAAASQIGRGTGTESAAW